jgi:hypothetical protein
MDFRQRDWSEMFGADTGRATAPLTLTKLQDKSTALMLEELWAQSVALREHALQVRAAAMEVRAMARDMRFRLNISQAD